MEETQLVFSLRNELQKYQVINKCNINTLIKHHDTINKGFPASSFYIMHQYFPLSSHCLVSWWSIVCAAGAFLAALGCKKAWED